MSSTKIHRSKVSDKQQIIDLLVLANCADPFLRWQYTSPSAYLKNLPIFLDALTAKSFETDSVNHVDDYIGTAVWLPPHIELDAEKLLKSFEQTLSNKKLSEALAIDEQMNRYHPREPHWYLVIMGVEPARQGQGIGSKLLGHTLALCDQDSTLAYLESTNPKNIPLYKHYGFELLGIIQVGDAPPIYPMLRKPQ